MPKELEHTSSPARIFDTEDEVAEYVKERLGENPTPLRKQAVNGVMTREYSDYLINTFGANNWYDWSYDNWGTKWDVSEVWLDDTDDYLKYDFDTAWCPPEGIYAFLVDKFPDVSISWFYREEGQEIAGYL